LFGLCDASQFQRKPLFNLRGWLLWQQFSTVRCLTLLACHSVQQQHLAPCNLCGQPHSHRRPCSLIINLSTPPPEISTSPGGLSSGWEPQYRKGFCFSLLLPALAFQVGEFGETRTVCPLLVCVLPILLISAEKISKLLFRGWYYGPTKYIANASQQHPSKIYQVCWYATKMLFTAC
jgi:hypothetical protein